MKAVIFDLDGVLIKTEKLHFMLYGVTLQKFNLKLTKKDYNKFFSGKKTKEAFETYLRYKKKKINSKTITMLIRFFRKMKGNILSKKLKNYVKLREGTYQLLKRLKKKYKLALATSTIKRFTDLIINGFELRRYFDVVIYAENVKKGKPCPKVYLKAAEKLKVNPKDCIVIEDSEAGIEAAKKAGMVCIAIKDPELGKRKLSKADYIIKNFKEIDEKLIEKFQH